MQIPLNETTENTRKKKDVFLQTFLSSISALLQVSEFMQIPQETRLGFFDLQFAVRNYELFNPLSANSTKWSNTLKQINGNLPTNCLNVFVHFCAIGA